MAVKTQLARRLTPESLSSFNEWQQELKASHPAIKLHGNPSLQIVSSRLLHSALANTNQELSIPAAFQVPVGVEVKGVRARRIFNGRLFNLALIFEDPEVITQLRSDFLLNNGVPTENIGYYDPQLYIGPVKSADFSLEGLAQSVTRLPPDLIFKPVEVEDVP